MSIDKHEWTDERFEVDKSVTTKTQICVDIGNPIATDFFYLEKTDAIAIAKHFNLKLEDLE